MRRRGLHATHSHVSISGARRATSSRGRTLRRSRFTCARSARSTIPRCFTRTAVTASTREDWWLQLEARQVGRLEEERARGRSITIERHLFHLSAEERPVAGMEHGAWGELVGCQEIREDALARRIELRHRADEEARRE